MPLANPAVSSGTLVPFGSATIPDGWLLCDGSAISRTGFDSLFSVIGTTYGAGDGSTSFNLPDLRQRFPLGKAASGTGSTLGGTGGTIDHLHVATPPVATTGAPSATVAATALTGSAASPTHTHSVTVPSFNTGTANPPFQTVNYIIKV